MCPSGNSTTSESSWPRPRVRSQSPDNPRVPDPLLSTKLDQTLHFTPTWQVSTEASLTAWNSARPSGKEVPRRLEPHPPRAGKHTHLPFLPGTLLIHTSKESSKAISSVKPSPTSPDGIIYSHLGSYCNFFPHLLGYSEGMEQSSRQIATEQIAR